MQCGLPPEGITAFALAGCTASDVTSILKKKRIPLQEFEISLTAEEVDEHPKVFTSINVEYVVYGDGINPTDVERAIDLSATKYCSVSAMLRPAVKITHSYRIEKPRVAAQPQEAGTLNQVDT